MGAVTVVMDLHPRRAIIEPSRVRALSRGTSLGTLSQGYLPSYNDITLAEADVENRVKALR